MTFQVLRSTLTQGFSSLISFFFNIEFKQKKTIVKTKVVIDGKEYYGEGTNKTTATSTLLQLQDENLPFERTEFSVALKKSLEDALIH